MSVKINQNILTFLHRRCYEDRSEGENPIDISVKMRRQLASIDRAVMNGILTINN